MDIDTSGDECMCWGEGGSGWVKVNGRGEDIRNTLNNKGLKT